MNLADPQDNTPLHRLMFSYGKMPTKAKEIFAQLMAKEPQLNRVNFSGATPLALAVMQRHFKAVLCCLE